MKICIWTPLPNHYERAFVKALSLECDLQVVYFGRFLPKRAALGWNANPDLMANEHRCSSLSEALSIVSDWNERVHVVPGYGGSFHRSLARHLVKHNAEWADWAESSSPGLKWIARYPVKAWWTRLVRQHALGSFAIGFRAERDFVKRGLSRSRMAFIPYVSEEPASIPPDVVTQEFNKGRNAFLFLGSLNRRKGIDLLLKAAAKALPYATDWVLIIVGGGDNRANARYREMAKKLNLADRVFFRGAVNPENLSSVIAASKVLILPSRYDGWGVALNEGILSGVAIVASHMCGAGEHLIIPGRNGFRFEAGNDRQLAEVMELYTHNSGLAELHGAASRSLAHLIDPTINAKAMLSTIRAWRGLNRPAPVTSQSHALETTVA